MIELLFFIALSLGFGVLASLLARRLDSFESLVMGIPVGLAIFMAVTCLFGQAIEPISYLLLFAAMAGVVIWNGMPGRLKIEIDSGWIIVMLIFIIYTYVFMTGAFSYPLLEDDDSWQHAAGIRYISEFHSFIQPEPRLIHYLAPYPPFYDALLSVLFQAGDSTLQDVMKTYNALLCGLVIPLFYVWSRNRFGKDIGLWSTFLVAVMPAFMTPPRAMSGSSQCWRIGRSNMPTYWRARYIVPV